MTQHEQKPESVVFRTREAQHLQLGEALSDETGDEKVAARWRSYALEHILEAEARGAAEQRRKDAANVTALEDRVKELEGENKVWNSAVNNALTWLENSRKVEARDELRAAIRRAAVIHEDRS